MGAVIHRVFYKAKYILLTSTFSSLFISIAFANIFSALRDSYAYSDYVSDRFVLFDSGQNVQYVTFEKLITDLRAADVENEACFLAFPIGESGMTGVYSDGTALEELHMITGRGFSKSDFDNRAAVALISEERMSMTVEEGDKHFLFIDGIPFEVIGVFRQEKKVLNKHAEIYFNAFEPSFSQNAIGVDSKIVLDLKHPNGALISNIQRDSGFTVVPSLNQKSFWRHLCLAVLSQPVTLLPLCLVLLATVLNAINLTNDWMFSRKKEIYAHILCGATQKSLNWMYIRQFLLIHFAGYFNGIIIAYGISYIRWDFFIGFVFSPLMLLFAFMFSFMVGAIVVLFLICSVDYEHIANLKGGSL